MEMEEVRGNMTTAVIVVCLTCHELVLKGSLRSNCAEQRRRNHTCNRVGRMWGVGRIWGILARCLLRFDGTTKEKDRQNTSISLLRNMDEEASTAAADDDHSIAAESEDDDDHSIVKLGVVNESEKTGDVNSPSKEGNEELSPTTEGLDTKRQVTFKDDKVNSGDDDGEKGNVDKSALETNVKIASALETVDELRPTGNQQFLAALHAAAVLLEGEGRYDEALTFFHEGLERKSKVCGDQHRLTLEAMNSVASCLTITKRFDEAEIHLNKCIQIASSEYGETDSFVLSVRINLGSLYRNTNRIEEAAVCFEDVVDKYRQNCAENDDDGEGELNAEALVAMSLLASTLEVLKQYDRAADLNQEILMVTGQGSKILGEEYAVFLTSVMNSLAYEQRMLGKDVESEAMYRRCLEKRAQTVGKHHADYLNTLQNFAVLLSTMNKFEEAERLFRQVIDGRRSLYGDEAISTMESKSFLGIMLSNAGEFSTSRCSLDGFPIIITHVSQ